MNKKEFGQLSAQQVKEFYEILRNYFIELSDELDTKISLEKDLENLSIIWYPAYELDFKIISSYLVVLMKMDREYDIGCEKGDPYQHVIDLIKSNRDPPVNAEDLGAEKLAHLEICFRCMIMNFICFASYRTDLHNLLAEARNGHKDSLFKAINIDHSIVNTKTAAGIIATANLINDGEFFDMLSRAIKGGYPRKPSKKQALLNFFTYIIEDAVGEEPINYEALHKLFTEEIPLYPNVLELQDSFGSFKKQLYRTRHRVKDIKT